MKFFLVWNKSTSCIERGYPHNNQGRLFLSSLINGVIQSELIHAHENGTLSKEKIEELLGCQMAFESNIDYCMNPKNDDVYPERGLNKIFKDLSPDYRITVIDIPDANIPQSEE